MQKISIILFTILLISGCSVFKKQRAEVSVNSETRGGTQLIDKLQNRNISNNNYYIQKAEVQVSGHGGIDKLLVSVKFRKPDQYLISIRNKTGIEAARLFISADTIMVNDRINRKLFCSSPDYLKKKYGLSLSVIPVLFGDFIGKTVSGNKTIECVGNKYEVDGFINGMKIRYFIDCKLVKPVVSILESSLSSERIEVRSSEFFEQEKNILPGNIEINDYKRDNIISIKIRKINFLWEGDIEFIPGNKYEIIELL